MAAAVPSSELAAVAACHGIALPAHRTLSRSPLQVRELVGEGQAGQFTARGGSIDFDFFCVLMGKKVKTLSNEDELKDAFRVLDKQGHGWITAKEMQLVCANLGEDMEEEEVDKMIAEAISNYDGKIYYDGFVKTMISRS